MVVSELRGEKIDIIPYNDEPARFVAKALSPARVREVLVDDESKQATVIVPDDQLSLAIGREGQNARLAARLTGWRIDIKSETDFAQTSQSTDDYGTEGAEEVGGRCQALSVRGRRCPNEALPGSPFCGLPKHQALSRFTTAAVAILEPLSDEEIADLSDPDKTWDDVVDIVTRAEELYGDQEELVAEGDEEYAEDGEFEDADGGEAEAEGDEGLEPAPEAAEPEGELDSEDAEAEVEAEEVAVETEGSDVADEAEEPAS
jgi:N utilization substance protein A